MSVTRVKRRGEKNNTSWRCARDVRRGPERQRVKIKPIYCDSFSLTWTAFGEYRGELTKSWTELGVLLQVLSRECDCCGTELCAWATREGRCSSRLLRWRLILRECLFPSKKKSWGTVSFFIFVQLQLTSGRNIRTVFLLFLKRSWFLNEWLLLLFRENSSHAVFDTLLPLCGRERHCRLFDALFDSTDFPVLSVKPLLWDLVLLLFFSLFSMS